ncbi:FGGY-family carbohydrate kinase [Ruania halotolerans]|uniref:FGGY-family carbohydrate kinase n=1 Tax=Ruania halotolerans TaxID=2897773 RepID=UPI001E4BBE36|nr:FGGY family carbohydrate kinase [Ruania halotolerans]UFU07065.1 xylulose kinase [Ruania halotolerans]
MTGAEHLLAIDLGTSGARAGVVTGTGDVVATHATSWSVQSPRPGWAEQDPNEWWAHAVEAVRGAMAGAGIGADAIAGLCVDTTSATVVAARRDGVPLRPAILWMDLRAVVEAEQLTAAGAGAGYSGDRPVSAEWGLPKVMWVRHNEADVWAETEVICDCADWLVHRLTGQWTMSVSHAAAKYFHDGTRGGWPEAVYGPIDGSDILARFPPRVLQVGEVVGPLTGAAAEALGLRTGTPVVEGAVDAYAAAVGLAVVRPGPTALITGSSHVVIAQTEQPGQLRGLWGGFTDAIVPGQFTIEGGQAATGTMVAWFRRALAGHAAAEAKQRGCDVYDVLNEQAAGVPIGSEGLVVLDHFQGNRSPHTDPYARGVIHGLGLHHSEAHVYRALLEGIAYGTAEVLGVLDRQLPTSGEVRVTGGPAASRLWMQIQADVLGVPLTFGRAPIGSLLGSAAIAAVGVGLFPDVDAATEQMVHLGEVLQPDPEAHEAYQFHAEQYLRTYPALREILELGAMNRP